MQKNSISKNINLIIRKQKFNVRNFLFKYINETPNGPAYTVSSIKNELTVSKTPCVVINPDQYIDFNFPKKLKKDYLYLPIHFNNHGNSSYVKINKKGKIVEIKEKN